MLASSVTLSTTRLQMTWGAVLMPCTSSKAEADRSLRWVTEHRVSFKEAVDSPERVLHPAKPSAVARAV
jgi:hypothetical protein